jgi:pimeloyl-ACP methyl ester carboxylesterase
MRTPSFEWITVGDHRLRSRRQSRPGAPSLLLTNAWPQTIRCWDQQWDALASRYDLTAVDLPGFGISPGTDEVMGASAQAVIVEELIKQLGLINATWIAPDVGVPIALSLAARRADLLSGLVLFDGPSEFPPDISWEGRLLMRSSVARWVIGWMGTLFTLATLWRGYRLGGRPSRAAMTEYVRAFASPTRFRRSLRFVANYPDELPAIERSRTGIEIPVLVTWGERDAFVSPSSGSRLAEALPFGIWQPLAGVGHYAHEDAGDEFLTMFNQWMETRKQHTEVAR